MKLLGLLLVMTACIGAGCYAAARLRRVAGALESLSAWTEEAAAYIRCERTELPSLLRELSGHPGYAGFTFLRDIAGELSPGVPPSLVWEHAVRCDRNIPPPAREALIRLGGTLGTTDCEGALAALRLCRTQLDRAAAQAREDCRVKGKLWRALGLLGGCMAAVLLI